MSFGASKNHECAPKEKGSIDKFGCHAEQEKGHNLIPCWDCLGGGCAKCEEGFRRLARCPNYCRQIAQTIVGSVFRAYRWTSEKSILPIGNSYLEQSAFFVNCVGFIESYHASSSRMLDAKNDRLKAVISNGRKRKDN